MPLESVRARAILPPQDSWGCWGSPRHWGDRWGWLRIWGPWQGCAKLEWGLMALENSHGALGQVRPVRHGGDLGVLAAAPWNKLFGKSHEFLWWLFDQKKHSEGICQCSVEFSQPTSLWLWILCTLSLQLRLLVASPPVSRGEPGCCYRATGRECCRVITFVSWMPCKFFWFRLPSVFMSCVWNKPVGFWCVEQLCKVRS